MTTSFFSFLRECDKEGDSTEDVFEVIKQCLDLSVEETVSFFIPNTTFSQDVKGLFFELRRTFSVETLNNLKSVLNEDSIIPIIEKLTTALEYDDFTWIHLMFKVDLLKVIQTFSQVHSIEEAESNPDVNEILDFNLSLCQKALRKTFKATKNCEGAIFEAFEYLLELPIKHSLKRFKGLVEDISESLGKKIDFVIQGDQGSLNKEKIDLLFESMVHLIRNAIDHGIEGPEKRVKKGKKKVGKIFINCSYLDAKTFRISLEDDGKGIDTQALLDKAIERGQIEKDKNVKFSEEEKLNLIFLPNLSTKKEVSEISGRGVGMDVVKTNLQKMNSKLSIETKSGAGTKFTIDIDISKKFLEF
jgi:chemotaxis protein histidine kinase CheA